MTTNRGVVCAGRLYCDVIFTGLRRMPSLGTETFADGLGLHAGGGAFITAAYLAAHQRPVSLMASIPIDPFGAIVMREITASNVDTSLCDLARENAEPQLTVAMVTGGDRAFVTRRSGAAIPTAMLTDLAAPGLTHLHIGELATLLEHPELIDVARANGLSISLDCSWDDDLPLNEVAGPISQVDVFLPNEVEAARLTEAGLRQPMAPVTAVKMGDKGAEIWTADGHFRGRAEAVTVVDTTGAGDAFNGGFLNRWLDGAPLQDCLDAGIACGTVSVQHEGGVGGVPHLEHAQQSSQLEVL